MTSILPLTRRSAMAGALALLLPTVRPTVALGSSRSSTRVLVLASMHKRHATSVTYGYDELYSAVAAFRPDLVGVEIRQEDLSRPAEYLSANYPLEMIELGRRYDGRTFGFDWLGDELAGRAVPIDWWKVRSPVKRLERSLDDDPAMRTPRRTAIGKRLEARSADENHILEAATPASLNDGRYDRIARLYYAELRDLVRGTPYQRMVDYYDRRDREIAEAIARKVRANPGKRVAVVCGADHRGPVVRRLLKMGKAVVLDRVADDGRTQPA